MNDVATNNTRAMTTARKTFSKVLGSLGNMVPPVLFELLKWDYTIKPLNTKNTE